MHALLAPGLANYASELDAREKIWTRQQLTIHFLIPDIAQLMIGCSKVVCHCFYIDTFMATVLPRNSVQNRWANVVVLSYGCGSWRVVIA
jgi:hypothetical protein